MFRPLIGTFVQEPQFRTLESALSDFFRLSNAVGWTQLHTLIRRQPVRCLIVDPFFPPTHEGELRRIFEAYPALPVIVYFSANPASFQKLLQMGRTSKTEYLIQSFEDSSGAILRMVRENLRSEFKLRLKRSLQPRFSTLTPSLQETLNALIDTPEYFSRSSQVAFESGLATASLYRALRRSRLQSPKRLIIASRATDALLSLKNPGLLLADVSQQLGYDHPRILSKHFHMVFGVSPSDSRRKVTVDAALEHVAKFVRS